MSFYVFKDTQFIPMSLIALVISYNELQMLKITIFTVN